MRDLLVTLIIFGSLPFIFKRAQIGVMMWVWISVMNPHRLTYGFAYDFNFAAIIAGVTLVSALISKDLRRPPMNVMMVLLFLFFAWTGVTTLFALYPDESFEKWTTLMKTALMVFLIPMLFHRKEDLHRLLWVVVLSIAYFGIKGGLWILLTGGGDRVHGPVGYIQENNALAVALIMTIPLLRYLQSTIVNRKLRWAVLGMMLLCGVAVLGSYSRGALLAASAMLVFLWWKSRRKLPFLIFALLMVPPMILFMPDQWFTRMETINTYEEDSSANLRLNSWMTMFNLANDRPVVGGGFEVAKREVYARYAPNPDVAEAHVAHSIYFQALGEHGYVGLGLYLMLFISVWRKAGWIMRATRDRPELAWARDLSAMMQVTLVGFATGGAFLSLVNFDVPYYLVGLMVATLALVQRELKVEAAPAAAAMDPRSPLAGVRR